jgi:Kip1 ubiquitination-promoting complex protein 1
VLVNLYFALLRLLFGDTTVSISSALKESFQALFCKATDSISEFARLGGALGHLHKTVPYDQPAEWKGISQLEVMMIDAAVMVYHLGVSSRFKASSQHQNTVRQSLARLSEEKKANASDPALNNTSDLITNVVHELRLMNYSHAILVGDKQSQINTNTERRQLLKQETMYTMTVFVAQLITSLSQRGTVFAYIPEYYMESMVDGFHSLRRTVPPLPLTSLPYSNGLTVILCAFIRFFNDPRIVNPDVRDLLLQSIGVLLQYNEYVTFIENLLSSNGGGLGDDDAHKTEGSMQVILLRGLLQAFDKKFWVTVTSILLRIWKGIGIRQNTVTEPPSAIFRSIFKEKVSQDAQLLNSFLNNLFNTLNTTISEFSVVKLDVTKMNPNDIRKANFLMELSINLLKILEVVSVDVPEVFIQSELNMTRLVELLLLILVRTTIGQEAARLDSVLVQEPHVSRAWILAPLVGIILNLDSHSPSGTTALMEALLTDASFKMEAFDYLLEYSWSQVSNAATWVKSLEEFVGRLKSHEASKITEQSTGTGVTRSSSIELCSICYGAPIDTQFEPCRHASCHKCISRHLLNNARCFFCNADVVSTHTIPPTKNCS